VVSRDCIDPETLAMWADGCLSPTQATSVEAHVADCALCQELVATFALTEPAAPRTPVVAGLPGVTPAADALAYPAALPWLTRWWLPLAGGLAAAALLVGFAMRQQPALPAPESTRAQVDAPPAPLPPAAAGDATSNHAPAPASPPATPPVQGARAARRPTPKPPVERVLPAAPPIVDTKKTPASSTFAKDILENIPSARDPWKISNMTTKRPGVLTITTLPIEAQRLNAGGSASGVQVGRTGRGGSSASATADTAALTSRGIAPSAEWWVVSPAAVEWQLATAATVTTLPIDMPSSRPIIGGASPSERVCWLFAGDAIWRTSDADKFTRVAMPADITIATLSAVDARHATVTATDGRRFSTIDGGTTWLPER